MKLEEISLAQVLEKTSGTSYFGAFVQLVGKTEELVLYKGIGKEEKKYLDILEEHLGFSISDSYLKFLSITNGGRICGMNLFSLWEEDYIDSLFYRNFVSNLKNKVKLGKDCLIVGEYEDGVIVYKVDDDVSSFMLVDIYNKKKLEFAFFEDLITFRFYYKLLQEGKKKSEKKKKEEEEKKLKKKKELEIISKTNSLVDKPKGRKFKK